MDIKQARKLPHLNFSPQEWFFSTRFHSLEARGLLIDLAAIQWMRGGFPNDRAAIERLVGVPVSPAVWDEIAPLLVAVGDVVGLKWVEEERQAAIDRIENAKTQGKNGAQKRYGKGGYSPPMGTLKAPHRHPIAILDCTGLERTELNRTEPDRNTPPPTPERAVAEAVAQHAGPNASLNFALSRDPVVMGIWNSTSKRWAKERGTNLPKLAAAIQMEQDEQGISRDEAARIVGKAMAAYVASPEGQGKYKRSMSRWFDAEGWREDPSSWQDEPSENPTKRSPEQLVSEAQDAWNRGTEALRRTQ